MLSLVFGDQRTWFVEPVLTWALGTELGQSQLGWGVLTYTVSSPAPKSILVSSFLVIVR